MAATARASFLTGRPVALARRASPPAGHARHAAAARRPTVCMSAVTFKKYQGLGNDFILVDNRHQEEPVITEEQAVKICDRNFGIGGDGVIFALPAIGDTDYTMRIFNSDGSEPEMCGNGIRCLARFVGDIDGSGPATQKVHTLAGLIVPVVKEDGQVCVDMGEPILKAADVPTTLEPNADADAVVAGPIEVDGEEWRVTMVSMGNPHALVFGKTGTEEFEKGTLDVNALDLHGIGPKWENHPAFPARTNTEFCQVLSRQRIRMRVWERGAGPTLACGTGACATVVAGVLEGRVDRTCVVDLPGGPLEIEWRESDNHIYMTGPAEYVFGGEIDG